MKLAYQSRLEPDTIRNKKNVQWSLLWARDYGILHLGSRADLLFESTGRIKRLVKKNENVKVSWSWRKQLPDTRIRLQRPFARVA